MVWTQLSLEPRAIHSNRGTVHPQVDAKEPDTFVSKSYFVLRLPPRISAVTADSHRGASHTLTSSTRGGDRHDPSVVTKCVFVDDSSFATPSSHSLCNSGLFQAQGPLLGYSPHSSSEAISS